MLSYVDLDLPIGWVSLALLGDLSPSAWASVGLGVSFWLAACSLERLKEGSSQQVCTYCLAGILDMKLNKGSAPSISWDSSLRVLEAFLHMVCPAWTVSLACRVGVGSSSWLVSSVRHLRSR